MDQITIAMGMAQFVPQIAQEVKSEQMAEDT